LVKDVTDITKHYPFTFDETKFFNSPETKVKINKNWIYINFLRSNLKYLEILKLRLKNKKKKWININ